MNGPIENNSIFSNFRRSLATNGLKLQKNFQEGLTMPSRTSFTRLSEGSSQRSTCTSEGKEIKRSSKVSGNFRPTSSASWWQWSMEITARKLDSQTMMLFCWPEEFSKMWPFYQSIMKKWKAVRKPMTKWAKWWGSCMTSARAARRENREKMSLERRIWLTVKKNQFPLSPSRKAVNLTAVINYQAGTDQSACLTKSNK